MVWLFVALGAYFLLAGAALIDKFLLAGKLDDPKIYAFYVGILSSAAFLLLPFGFWGDPPPLVFVFGIAAGASQIFGCYFYFSALKKMEAARAVPAVGSLVPIAAFFLTALASGGEAVLTQNELAGFFLLIAGGWMITAKGFLPSKIGLRSIFLAAFLFASNVVLAKLVYLQMPFLKGFLLMAFGSTTAAMGFLFFKSVRRAVFSLKGGHKQGQPNLLFFFGQTMGGSAFLLQSLAVSLAPQANVPVINALAGAQYVFIFIFSLFLAKHFPKVFIRKKSPTVLAQKIIAILLIIIGLVIFAAD